MKQIKVGIVGGAGYTAGELLRILVHHPNVEIVFVNSTSNAGNKITDVHGGLIGETDLVFTSEFLFDKVDCLFLCSAHGASRIFLEERGAEIPDTVKIVDLAQDFRDESNGFIYGLPEMNRAKIKTSQFVANPGCFATAIQLGLLPLANAGLISDEIHINAVTGSTGAGVKPSSTTHFSWRNNNISIYKVFNHQHLKEIGQTMRQLQAGFDKQINFIPMRGDFPRGIYVTTYTKCTLTEEEAVKLYTDYYKDAAFTFVTEQNPDLKQVVNTNKALVYVKKYDDKILIVSMIDNLLKGASGQAVQNMNLIFGLDEKAGLGLKSIGF